MKRLLMVAALLATAHPIGQDTQVPESYVASDGYFITIIASQHEVTEIDWLELGTRISEDFLGDVCRVALITPPEDLFCIAWGE
jgi:hypothetical protein